MSEENTTNLLYGYVIYLILLLMFTGMMFYFIRSEMNGASVWSDYYAKEIARQINLAEPNQKITINIQKATEIAKNNRITDFNSTFYFINDENKICVKISDGKTCYFYFNNVNIEDKEVELGVPENILVFKVVKK
ncbi:MAG: hypothetical protein AABY10_01455 [Nanoarchaeota archaeon]